MGKPYRDEIEKKALKRQTRELVRGGTYHVMGRGIRRMRIVDDISDYMIFRMILLELHQKYPFELHSFCMMTNHFHMLLTTQEDTSLPILMRNLMYLYARNYNGKHGYSLHEGCGRYQIP